MSNHRMHVPTQPTRRQFLGRGAVGVTAIGAAAIGAPSIVPHSVFGTTAPSNRINMGIIGLGTRGLPDMVEFMKNDDVQIRSICDVNRASLGYRDETRVMGREPALKIANSHYASKQGTANYTGIDAVVDYREIIDQPDIDAVAIVVPDHWHAMMTIRAAEAGKDIFCQKPLSLTIRQGQEMVRAVRKNSRILQTGSQWRSNAAVRFACELVLNGRIGQLQSIYTTIALNNKQGPGPGWQPMPVPEGFDYDRWLGPAPEAPYHTDRCIYKFRFGLDYSGGQITNFGAHALDIAQTGNGTSLTGPVEVEGLQAQWPPKGSLFTTAITSKFRARYANGVELTCESAAPYFGARFEGTEGWVEFTSKGVKTYPESLLSTKFGPNEIKLPAPNLTATPEKPGNFYSDHLRNFLDCVKSREEPIEPVEIGHRTATICHLGNIALQKMEKLQWDPESERFPNDEQANSMLDRPSRGEW